MPNNTNTLRLMDGDTVIVCPYCERIGETCPECSADFMDGEPREECAHLITIEYRNRDRECVTCGSVA